ncbi:MAG TPA: FAD-dependent oxidoreductase, partial [Methylomirabilota bacterium]
MPGWSSSAAAWSGWGDTLLLERRSLTGGTTWHAAGLVGRLRGSRTASRLVQASAELYARLEAETGHATGWRRCGSLVVARTPERLIQLCRSVALGRAVGIDAHVIGPGDVARQWPLCRTDAAPQARRPGGGGVGRRADLSRRPSGGHPDVGRPRPHRWPSGGDGLWC